MSKKSAGTDLSVARGMPHFGFSRTFLPDQDALRRTAFVHTITVRVAVEAWPEASVPVKASAVGATAALRLIFNSQRLLVGEDG